jgi:ribosomal protein S18 acetylase RimI-like enzyme
MPHIRPAIPADAANIADGNIRMALETENLSLDPPTVLAGVAAGIADSAKGQFFVAEVDGQFAGQLLITYEWSDWRNANIWWIQSVYVYPQFRRQGVFRALYQHAAEQARNARAIGLRLYVEHLNHPAQATYERLGMISTGYLVMEQLFHQGWKKS